MKPQDTSLRKRSQINQTNKVMFAWIAGISVVVGFAAVGGLMLAQMLFFNERVLAEKERTISTLKSNNANIPELQSQIRALDANGALAQVKALESDQALQVILDALPSEANSLALGASLHSKLLAGIPGLTINSLQVDPVFGVETNVSDDGGTSGMNEISFRFSVSGSEDALKAVLENLERSIRAIHIDSLRIESQGATTRILDVQGRTFYEPTRVVELRDKVVK